VNVLKPDKRYSSACKLSPYAARHISHFVAFICS